MTTANFPVSTEQAYQQIADLTCQRVALDNVRFKWVKLIRAIKELQVNTPAGTRADPGIQEFLSMAMATAEDQKRAVWDQITPLDNEIDRLMRLCQEGAFNA